MPRHEFQDARPSARADESSPTRRNRRLGLAAIGLLAILVPYSVTMITFWAETGKQLSTAANEQRGAAYLRPLASLIATAADAQSAVVSGARPDRAAINAAIAAVNSADARYGGQLGSTQRWTTVRGRLTSVLNSGGGGPSAYPAYAQSLDLLLDLGSSVADSSGLILDPRLDSYYLMDATAQQLPKLMVNAGRMSDLDRLLGGQAARSPELAVAANEVRTGSTAIKSELAKSFAATSSSDLAQGLIPALDQFGDATTALVPPAAGLNFVPPSRASVQNSRLRVRDSALALDQAGLTQLDALLADRADGSTSQRRLVLAVTAAGALTMICVLWLAARRRRGLRPESAAPGAGRSEPAGRPEPVQTLPGGDRFLAADPPLGRPLAAAGPPSGLEPRR